jgi:orotate phosphoribosyltransferase
MLTRDQVFAIFRQAGTFREGHFRLTSGRHSNQFFLMPHTFQHPALCEPLARALAEQFVGQGIETVVGPATGGIILAYEVARQIGLLQGGQGPRAIFTEKTPAGGMALKRGWTLRQGERVLIVEDAITTGGSVQKAMAAIAPFEPEIVAVGCLVDRSNGQADFGVPLRSVMQHQVESWAPEDCPLCQAGVALVIPKG